MIPPLKPIHLIGIKGFNRVDNADLAPDAHFFRGAAARPAPVRRPNQVDDENLFQTGAVSRNVDF
jgi:hypothetical protein